MPKISVIVPFSRGIKEIEQILRDFRNQTFRNFELLIVRDGSIPEDIQNYINTHKKENPNAIFSSIKKDRGNMKDAPGTNPRNHGISIAKGEFVCFCDDDDRYRDSYLEAFAMNMRENTIVVQQMACSESRIYRNGNPDNIVLIPEIDLQTFPVICHYGTPCSCLPTAWAKAEPWRCLGQAVLGDRGERHPLRQPRPPDAVRVGASMASASDGFREPRFDAFAGREEAGNPADGYLLVGEARSGPGSSATASRAPTPWDRMPPRHAPSATAPTRRVANIRQQLGL